MLQEGRAAAAIDDPHLLRMLDIGRVGVTVYLITELLHGCSLAGHLRDDLTFGTGQNRTPRRRPPIR